MAAFITILSITPRCFPYQGLKLLNSVIFPIKYPDQIYVDCMACEDITQLGAWSAAKASR